MNSSTTDSALKEPTSFDTFLQLDIRVGTILAASLPDWSEKLIELRVNFGPVIGERTIFAGLRRWYVPEDFIGKQSIFLVNLPPRKMGPGVSEGMIMAADADDNQAPSVLLFESLAPDGACLH